MLLGDRTPTVEVGVQVTKGETPGETLVETPEVGEILEEGETLEGDWHHTMGATD